MPASSVATGCQAIWALHWLIFLEYYFRLPSVLEKGKEKNTGNISGKFEQLAIEDLHVYEILQ